MIEFQGVYKDYRLSKSNFRALDGINLKIKSQSIHGIIGLSGAGKSTLIRLVNRLETYEEGCINVLDYNDIRKLNKESTRMLRQSVGMIFQSFNLLSSKTVLENVLLPLKVRKKIVQEDIQAAMRLLDDVGLLGKEYNYPHQLSGGQKQRVSIARALINNPSILLCDEITSALDPVTTKTILSLIERLKHEKKLTVVVVTHDMHVIERLCDVVSVMDQGKIIEEGQVDDILVRPRHAITKALVETVGYNLDVFFSQKDENINVVILKFPKHLLNGTIISDISRVYAVTVNILFAKILPNVNGVMVLRIEGEGRDGVIKHLKSIGVCVLND